MKEPAKIIRQFFSSITLTLPIIGLSVGSESSPNIKIEEQNTSVSNADKQVAAWSFEAFPIIF